MLRLVDEHFAPSQATPSLLSISRHIRESAEQLALAHGAIASIQLHDRMKLECAVFEAASKLAAILAAIAQEVAANNKGL